MTIGLHDPRLTAYALDELEGPEKEEVEAAVNRSAALRQAVQEIRETAQALSKALLQEAPLELTREQLQSIRQASEAIPRRNAWYWAGGLSAAAALLLAAFFIHGAQQFVAPAANEEIAQSQTVPKAPRPPADELKESPAARLRQESPAIPEKPAAFPAAAETKALAAQTSGPAIPNAEAALNRLPVRQGSAAPIPSASIEAPASGYAVSGVVTDTTGGVIPGALVEVFLANGDVRTLLTDEAGRFVFDSLSEKPVRIRVSLEGFRTFENRLHYKGGPLHLKVKLDLGAVAEVVIVEASPPSTTSTELAVGLPQEFAVPSSLPFNGRNHFELQLSAAGGSAGKAADIEGGSPARGDDFNTEAYDRIEDNPFRAVAQNPLSTFSIDVDTASYSNLRRFLNSGGLPPKDSVRIEEMVNYFSYDYPPPSGRDPFSVNVEIAEAPWHRPHLLARIGLKGREIESARRPPSNLVFLLDVSGSMDEPNKLPLLQSALKLLVEKLTEQDRVAIVVYAGSSGLVLPSTPGGQKAAIMTALDNLRAGGSTNGGAGIQLAYDTAQQHFLPGGVNRVILATDGDFNVGTTSRGELTRLIEEKAKSGVFLSVLGFGMGNYKDSTLEKLADKGNGNYGYIDTINEARKLLVEQMEGTLITVAKDVKIQVELNPAQVSAYRLIGYENRMLAAEDFNDDKKDAGEIGAGHTVTALYELVPAGVGSDIPSVDPLKYQQPARPDAGRFAHEILTVKLRYKRPDEDVSNLIEVPAVDEGRRFEQSSNDFHFAAAVAAFGMLLRESEHKGNASYDMVLQMARRGRGADRFGYRAEFIDLVNTARQLAR